MINRAFNVPLEKNPLIKMKVIPGHFTTSSSHVSHFLDFNEMRSNALIARDVAEELAVPFLSGTLIETIVCMERTEVVGAYLAEELLEQGILPLENSGEIHVLTPIHIANGNLIFQGSTIEWVSGKAILLLIASISSGMTVKRALDCISFYGGKTVAISSLFRALGNDLGEKQEINVNALFTSDYIPGYKIWNTSECELCKKGIKLDAIVSSEGYTELA